MFRSFAKLLAHGAEDLMRFHPSDLTALLELAWDRRSNNPGIELGRPARRSAISGFGTTWFGNAVFSTPPPGSKRKYDRHQAAHQILWHKFYQPPRRNPRGD